MRRQIWLLLLAVAAPLPGQAPAAADSARLAAIRTLRRGTGVKLVYAGLGTVEGDFVRLTGDSAVLVRGRAWHTVALTGVDSIWARGGHAGEGALYGGVIGAVAVAALFHGLVKGLCEAPPCHVTRATLIGAVGGAAIGAGLGAAVGNTVPRWRLHFPSPTLESR